MLRDIKGHVALVTGASQGIGRAVALTLAEEGCDVALAARNTEALEEVAAACRELGVRAVPIVVDLMQSTGPNHAVSTCAAELGRLDILVPNAGVAHYGGAVDGRMAAWEQMVQLNLLSVMRLTKAAVPLIRKCDTGVVAFISSISGKHGYAGAAGYCASKHGVNGFAAAIFEDLKAYGTKVCAICPGFVSTELATNLGVDPDKVMLPEDVAEAVRFVAKFPLRGCPTEIVLKCQHPEYV